MRISDFILLGEEEKKRTLLHQGVLVAKRDNRNCKVFLFQLDSYYVEMFCNFQSKSIEQYCVFDDTTPLQPYLQNISLDGL